VNHVEFISWTWPVNGVTYPETAEVSYSQTFSTSADVVNDVVRLVQSGGEWRWFFGRSQQFVDEQISLYGSSESSIGEADFSAGITPVVDAGLSSKVVQEQSGVQMLGDPQWWVVPFAEGYGGPANGYLYFGVLVRNTTDAMVSVGVSFRSYSSDGTPFPGCSAPVFGEGAGVTTTIAPRETAWITCQRSIVPSTLQGLQLTARMWDIAPLQESPLVVVASDQRISAIGNSSSPMQTAYNGTALIRTMDNHDQTAVLLFRFYDDNGIQLGTCDTQTFTVEPEVAQRVSFSFPVFVDASSPQPVELRVEGQV